MFSKIRPHAVTLIAVLVVTASLGSLLPWPSDVLATVTNSTRAKGLAACQNAIDAASQAQQNGEAQSLRKCISAVRDDKLKRNLSDVSNTTAALCQKQLRKIKDSRGEGKSFGEKAKAKMMKACDPNNPKAPKPFTDADVLNVTTVAALPGLGGQNLEPACAAQTNVMNVTTTAKLVDCVVQLNTKVAAAGVKASSPQAPKHLKDAGDKVASMPPPPDDPSAPADAAGAADDAHNAIDHNDDGIPDTPVTFNPAARIVFVSSTTTNGNFSGVPAAGELCQSLASAAKLPGNFLPWVSDALLTIAPSQLNARTYNPNIPYVTVTGRVVANQMLDFLNGAIVSPINVDENGASVPDDPVWTATLANNDNALPNCTDFTDGTAGQSGVIGRTSLSDSGWSDVGTQTCDLPARIYCIEVDLS